MQVLLAMRVVEERKEDPSGGLFKRSNLVSKTTRRDTVAQNTSRNTFLRHDINLELQVSNRISINNLPIHRAETSQLRSCRLKIGSLDKFSKIFDPSFVEYRHSHRSSPPDMSLAD